jgi:hypothetical protein
MKRCDQSNNKTKLTMMLYSIRKAVRTASAALALGALIFGVGTVQRASAATAAFWGINPYFTWTSATDIANVKVSGFTTIVLFSMDVNANGDLAYDGTVYVHNGVYVGPSGWGAALASIKKAPSTVYRIEICFGGWGSASFNNIESLVNSGGTGSNSILYKNFQALKNATGVDAISDDDEQCYDINSCTAFGQMIGALGMKFTICPYTYQSFWVQLKNNLGDICDQVYLQCYEGGAGNDPSNWNSAFGGGVKVIPGMETSSSPSAVQSQMNTWQSNAGVTGGILWWVGDNLSGWAGSILNGIGLQSGTYSLKNLYSGSYLNASAGSTANGTPLNQWSYTNSTSMQWIITSLGGNLWQITEATSGRAVTAQLTSTTNNLGVQLWDNGDAATQIVMMITTGNGCYTPVFVQTGKTMGVIGASKVNGASIVQYPYNGAPNAQWQFQPLP